MASDKPTALESFRAGIPAGGENTILSSDEVSRIRALLSNLSNDSEGEISPDISPDELSDKSGGIGPFAVAAHPADTEGGDERVVVGPNSSNIDTYILDSDQDEPADDDIKVVPRSVGRSEQTPGILYTSKGSYIFTEETVIDLWDFNNHPHPDAPEHYQTATLFMDLRSWNGEQAITSDFFIWGAGPYHITSSTIYDTVEDLIKAERDVIIPMAHVVVHRDTDYVVDSDVPNKVHHIYSFWSSLEIDRTNMNFSAVPVKITGTAGSGEYSVDIHANGKHNDKTTTGTLEVHNLNISETLPNGIWLSADYTSLQVTG